MLLGYLSPAQLQHVFKSASSRHYWASAAAATRMPTSAGKTPTKRTPKQQPPAIVPDAPLLEKAAKIAAQLQLLYPSPPIPLTHSSPFQLLCAVMLSAQTTDKKVNEVTPELFTVAPDAAAMAAQDIPTVQKIIQPIGLAPTKAKNLVNMAKLLLERHGGQVPSSFAELEDLPGVGHKTASVVMAQAFGRAAFPVDTHIHRLAERWGLSSGKSVEQTEADLKALLPGDTWRDVHLQIIYFGREHCPAKQHDVQACPICSWAAAPGSGNFSKKAATPKRKAAAAVAAVTATPAAAADEFGVGAAVAVASEASAGEEASTTAARRRRRL